MREVLGLLPVRKDLFRFKDEYTANMRNSRIPNSISNIRITEKTSLLSSATKKERERKSSREISV